MYQVPSTKTRETFDVSHRLKGGVSGDTHNGEGRVLCTMYQVPRPERPLMYLIN